MSEIKTKIRTYNDVIDLFGEENMPLCKEFMRRLERNI